MMDFIRAHSLHSWQKAVFAIFTFWCGTTFAQQAIPVGKGSYAEFPPEGISKDAARMQGRDDLHIVDQGDRPVPTNKYWTHIIFEGKKAELWNYPTDVVAQIPDLRIFYPTEWGKDGRIKTESPLLITADGFSPTDAKAVDWSDWAMKFRLADGDKKIDVTLGEGMPYVWMECAGISPKITLGTKKDAATVSYFGDDGQAGPMPATADHFGLTIAGRAFGIFAPTGTAFALNGDTITVTFPAAAQFLIVCPLPSPKDLAYFYKYAYAVPRKTQLEWNYDLKTGCVATTWNITTDCLQGNEHAVIQGWLPHHLRNTTVDFQTQAISYKTVRGEMKCATGNTFKIAWPFHGFLPFLPAPKASGLEHDYEPERMQHYLTMAAKPKKFGDDTYWGGKDFLLAADYMHMARETGDETAAALQKAGEDCLADWFTYTPGEKAKFFARYPKYKAMIGFKDSYGSGGFNDQHFHYGYFTLAAALFGMADPKFLDDYGPMVKLVSREYANYDRKDNDFPFLRTFDVWAGHSWAGGTGSPGGNNQESSSEAVQSWIGLFMLGNAMHDQEMTAAGAMGYAMETQAANEYWFNRWGTNYPPTYTHPMIGMVWSGGQVFGTYFTGDPAWIYAINMLPWSPGFGYLTDDRAFSRKSFEAIFEQRKLHKEKKPLLEDTGSGLGNVLLNYQSQYDPDAVAEKMDELWDAKNPIATDNATGGLTYYRTHITRQLGFPLLDTWMSIPTASAYLNERTKVTTYVVFNPGNSETKVDVYQRGARIGSLQAAAGKLTVTTNLEP